MKSFSSALVAILPLVALVPQSLAHMQISKPYPIRSQDDPANPWNDKDYSYTSPLTADGSNFPCKGYQNDRPIVVKAHYQAGQQYTIEMGGSATHGGGSCQLSLSYDNGKTFRVIKSMIGGCPLKTSYSFTIPTYAPDGSALLAWTWFNKIGNREIYMNCVQVEISGSSNSTSAKARRSNHLLSNKIHKTRRDTYTSFDDLPYIWKANLPGNSNCKTVEGEEPVFPQPGPDVEYGSGMSSSSPVTSGQCDDEGPPGKSFVAEAVEVKPQDQEGTPSISTFAPGATGAPGSGSYAATSQAASTPAVTSAPAASSAPAGSAPAASTPSYTYVPSSGGSSAPAASSSAPAAASSAPAAGSSAPAASSSYAAGSSYAASASAPAGSGGSSSGGSSGGSSSAGSSGGSSGGSPGGSSSGGSSGGSSAGSCTPGAIVCDTPQSWSECAAGGVPIAMGGVPAGLECVNGKFIRAGASSLGACTSGTKCLRGGKGWATCGADGYYVDMGGVPAGTTCSNGQIA